MIEDGTKKDETYSLGFAKSDQRIEKNDPSSYRCNLPQGLIETKKQKESWKLRGRVTAVVFLFRCHANHNHAIQDYSNLFFNDFLLLNKIFHDETVHLCNLPQGLIETKKQKESWKLRGRVTAVVFLFQCHANHNHAIQDYSNLFFNDFLLLNKIFHDETVHLCRD